MAASMWRMNGLCRSMTGVLLLCALLFSSEVICEDVSAPPTPSANTFNAGSGTTPAAPVSTAASDQGAAPADGSSGDSVGSTVAPTVVLTSRQNDQARAAPENSNDPPSLKVITEKAPLNVVPTVVCVGKEEIPEQSAVKAQVGTKSCNETKAIIEETPAPWCSSDKCDLKIFQEKNNILMTSSDAKLSSLVEALKTEALKNKLNLKNVDVPKSSNTSVFVGVLVTGLLAALGMIVGYFKCQRKPDTKGEKLAEKAFPVDQENQGNTLASEAPLIPPPETQEKPSVNGESLEAVKIETSPPTNGHSTAKTADTEL
ncbi:uncharacterized protein cd34 [Poecilia formosa]|uniref:Uncharacterized LOC103139157 n=1 Tax=Poecilia formosa TaxID=48698 RepID=A0A087Y645_POEFO|nr:PREDICTED: uncharacterized protein LOC103139157 [Poecilia formosa]